MGFFEKDKVCLCQCGRRIIMEKGKQYVCKVEYGIPMLLRIRDSRESLFLKVDGLGELRGTLSVVEPDETGIKIAGSFHFQQDSNTTELMVPFNALIDYTGQCGWLKV